MIWSFLLVPLWCELSPPATEAPAAATGAEVTRRVELESPTIIWSEKAHWNGESEAPLPPLGAALWPDSLAGDASPALLIGREGRLVLLDTSGLVAVALGPQQLRVTRTESGQIALYRGGPSDGSEAKSSPDILTFPVPAGWSEGYFPPLPSDRSPTLAQDRAPSIEGILFIDAPADRAVRPPELAEGGPELKWRLLGPASADARFDIEIAEVNELGQALATVERWWRLGGRALRLWHAWRPEARYRVTIETARSGPQPDSSPLSVSRTVEVLSNSDLRRLASIEGDLQGRAAALGPEATRVMQALALERFGLDSEARTLWWGLLIERPDHPQAELFLYRALADL